MPKSKKARVSESSEDSDMIVDGEEVSHTFEGQQPKEEHTAGILDLLKHSLNGLGLDLQAMADIVVAQNYVGTAMVQVFDEDLEDEDEDPIVFGLTSVVNLSQQTANKEKSSYLASVCKALLGKVESSGCEESAKALFRAALKSEGGHTGLLLKDRHVNLPDELNRTALTHLLNEIQSAKDIKLAFDFSHIILVSKLYKEKMKGKPEKEFYAYEEDEQLAEAALATCSYTFSEGGVAPQHRRLMLFSYAALQEALSKLQ